MHVERAVEARESSSVLRVREVGDLVAILAAQLNVVVLERPAQGPLAVISPYADRIARASAFRFLAPVRADGKGLAALHEALPPGDGRDLLVGDVSVWVGVLAELTDASSVGVRMDRADEPTCPRFHFDRVLLRLVLTYSGPATEWIDERDVDRCRLAKRTERVYRRGAAVQRASALDVVLLKGSAWPGNGSRGAVHRSPAAASRESPRLVLTLDALT